MDARELAPVLKMDIIKKDRLRRLAWLNTRLYPPIEIGPLEKTIYSLIVYSLLQSVWLVVCFWSSEVLEMKIKFFETVIVMLLCIGIFTDIYFNMGIGSPVQQAMDMDYFIRYPDDGNCDVESKVQYLKNREEIACKELNIVRVILTLSSFSYFLFPIYIKISIELLFFNKPFEELSFPNIFYIPFTGSYLPFSTFSFIFYELATTAMFFAIALGIVTVYANVRFSMRCITDEIGLFLMSLSKLDELSSNRRMLDSSSGEDYTSKFKKRFGMYDVASCNESLRRTIRALCIHHQIIFKKNALLNRAYVLRMIYGNVYICLQLAVSVFCFQKGDLMTKFRYGFFVISCLVIAFIYSNEGHELVDKIEEMRQALYAFPWYEMPMNIQKTILMIMIRNTNVPPLRVFNIIRMDRSNFVNVVRAIYSYFNVLKGFN